jgi:hypothetical protein
MLLIPLLRTLVCKMIMRVVGWGRGFVALRTSHAAVLYEHESPRDLVKMQLGGRMVECLPSTCKALGLIPSV